MYLDNFTLRIDPPSQAKYNPLRVQSVTERRRKKVYGLQDWAAVQRVYKQTHSKRETARILKISRSVTSTGVIVVGMDQVDVLAY